MIPFIWSIHSSQNHTKGWLERWKELTFSGYGVSVLQHLKSSRYLLGEGNGTPLQHSCLETPMDRGAWWAAVPGVAASQTRPRGFAFPFHFHALEKEMATHSSVLAWRIPGTGESGGLPSMGSHRVGHDWRDLAAAAADTSCSTMQICLTVHLKMVKMGIPWQSSG